MILFFCKPDLYVREVYKNDPVLVLVALKQKRTCEESVMLFVGTSKADSNCLQN